MWIERRYCKPLLPFRHRPIIAAAAVNDPIAPRTLGSNEDALGNDELTIQMMRAAMQGTPVRGRPSARMVDRAKEFLHAHDGSRLSLEEVSSAVGVSPVYLTQEFTRSEGVPLYRYYLSLRLARALTELPHSDDITGLALDLGFSCHSHFTLAFRKAFGMTPSQYRRIGNASERHSLAVKRCRPSAESCLSLVLRLP